MDKFCPRNFWVELKTNETCFTTHNKAIVKRVYHRTSPVSTDASRMQSYKLVSLSHKGGQQRRKEVFSTLHGMGQDWRDISDIVVKPVGHAINDSYKLFISSLHINIKEHLNGVAC